VEIRRARPTSSHTGRDGLSSHLRLTLAWRLMLVQSGRHGVANQQERLRSLDRVRTSDLFGLKWKLTGRLMSAAQKIRSSSQWLRRGRDERGHPC
jgi:hypothetical protein